MSETKIRVKIAAGLTIDDPPATVKWGTSESELQALLGPVLRHVTKGYWTAHVQVFGGLRCSLGFHFDRERDALEELEFFRDSYSDQKESFDEFQRFFEATFGPPTTTEDGTEGFANYVWSIGPIEIVHYVFDRFGPEEHMRIRRRLGFLQRLRRFIGAA